MSDTGRLLAIMARLRDPDTGCPWDKQQDFQSVAPYTLEEAYEVVDAIDRNHMPDLQDELGDLLFQVVFHARMAQEKGLFTYADVVEGVCNKLIDRHPHVFGDSRVSDENELNTAWEAVKKKERLARDDSSGGALEGIALALPALKRAQKLQSRAARDGFDWPQIEPVFDKIYEELNEVKAELAAGSGHEALLNEMGDVIFACVNLARHLRVDAEQAARSSNQKFENRFAFIETMLAESSKEMADCDLEELESLWVKAKQAEENR